MNIFAPKGGRRIASLADFHYGKRTATFAPDILDKRLQGWAGQLAQFKEKGVALELFLLGDVNDGTMIYATQEHHQAQSDVRAQAKECAQLLARLTERLETDWGRVTWHAVPGNHGRTSKFANEAANWDVQTYDNLKLMLEAKGSKSRVDAYEGDRTESVFLKRVRIYGHGYLLHHGHTVRMYQTIPWYGLLQRALRWYSVETFRVFCCGHFHGSGLEPFNRFELMRTGSPVDGDDWALETFGITGDAHGWTFGVTEAEPLLYPTRIPIG